MRSCKCALTGACCSDMSESSNTEILRRAEKEAVDGGTPSAFSWSFFSTMYPAVFLLLHLLSLRAVLTATVPVQPNLSAGRPNGPGFVDNDITANQSSLVYESPSAYTGPLNAQWSALCDGANFGTGLNLRSCVDAVQQLDRESTQVLSFAPREWTPKAKHLLPMRSSSGEPRRGAITSSADIIDDGGASRLLMLAGDGRCVIDVVSATKKSPPYYASTRMIWDAAMKVIQTCVDGRGVNDRGGYIGQVGKCPHNLPDSSDSALMNITYINVGSGRQGALVVIVRNYEPNVGCNRQMTGQNNCWLVLDSLPADRVPRTYGPEGTREIAVHTPFLWRAS